MKLPITENKEENDQEKNQEGRNGFECFLINHWFFMTQFKYTPNKQKEYALKPILNVNHITPNTKF